MNLEQFDALPAAERKLIRRAAYGMQDALAVLADVGGSPVDLETLRQAMDAREAALAVMPERWTDEGEADVGEDAERRQYFEGRRPGRLDRDYAKSIVGHSIFGGDDDA